MDPRFITPANRGSEPIATTRISQNKLYGEDLLDFVSSLKEFNRKRLKERKIPGTLPFQTMPTPVVELVFHICSLFDLPSEVKFLALEIFDRFIVHHFTDLWEYACDSSKDESAQKRYWRRISLRAQKQALLRIVSSIQIASKFVLQSKSISLKHILQYLTKCGHAYNLHSVYLSEVRVFSSLGCKVPFYSVYDFTRALLEALQYWTDVDHLYPTCEKVLDFTFLQRDEIYLRYFWMGTNRWERSRQERLQFADLELNMFLMAASVVVCSLYIHHLEGLGPNKASDILSELADISSNDIRGLAVIIAQMVLGSRTVTFRACD